MMNFKHLSALPDIFCTYFTCDVRFTQTRTLESAQIVLLLRHSQQNEIKSNNRLPLSNQNEQYSAPSRALNTFMFQAQQFQLLAFFSLFHTFFPYVGCFSYFSPSHQSDNIWCVCVCHCVGFEVSVVALKIQFSSKIFRPLRIAQLPEPLLRKVQLLFFCCLCCNRSSTQFLLYTYRMFIQHKMQTWIYFEIFTIIFCSQHFVIAFSDCKEEQK